MKKKKLLTGIGLVLVLAIVSLAFVSFSGRNSENGIDDSTSTEKKETVLSSIANLFESKLTKEEYIKWVHTKENGYYKSREVSKFRYTLQYEPLNYIVLKNNWKTVSKENFSSLKKGYSDLHYFTFKIVDTTNNGELLKSDLKSNEEYSARVDYFAFRVGNDMKLIDGTDTLSCNFCQYERTYGISPEAVFTIGFAKGKETTSDKTFEYQDKVFGNGIIKMKLEAEALAAEPKLELE